MNDLYKSYQERIETNRSMKERWVKDNPEQTDAPSVIAFRREGEEVAVVYHPPVRDTMITALQIGTYGFCAEDFCATMETLTTEVMTNPVTGKEWEQGEMMTVATQYPEYLKDGTLMESYCQVGYDRDDNWFYISNRFTVEDGEVIWDEEQVLLSNDEGNLDGFLRDVFEQIMEKPTLRDTAEQLLNEDPIASALLKTKRVEEISFDQESKYVIQDYVTSQWLHQYEAASGVALQAEPGTKRAEKLKERYAQEREKVAARGEDPDDYLTAMDPTPKD